jgi:chromosome segregation ATPase
MDGFPSSVSELRAAVQQLEDSVTLFEKTNRMRKSALIEKASELFARKHRVDSMELEMGLVHDRYEASVAAHRNAQRQVNNLNRVVARVNQRLESELKSESELSRELKEVGIPALKQLKRSVLAQRKRKATVQRQFDSMSNEVFRLTTQASDLENVAQLYRTQLVQLDRRISELNVEIEAPVNDLKLEFLATETVEKLVAEKLSDSIGSLEESILQEMDALMEIENTNRTRLSVISSRRARSRSSGSLKIFTPEKRGRRSITASPGAVEDTKTELGRISQFDASIDHLKSRHRAIEEMENVTTTLQEMWRDERHQIEDSWSYKMDDLRSLQLRCAEVDDLLFAIDEISTKVVGLKTELGETHRVLQSRRNEVDSIPRRLDRLYAIHPQLQARVNALHEQKRLMIHRAHVIGQRHIAIEKLQAEVSSLEIALKHQMDSIRETSDQQELIRSQTEELESRQARLSARSPGSPKARVDFPTPENFSGSGPEEEEEEEHEPAELPRPRVRFEMLKSQEESDRSQDEMSSEDEPVPEDVFREAEEAIAMPLVHSQFWVNR